MVMRRLTPYNRGYMAIPDDSYYTQFREISKCVIRKDHSCGKFLGASKSCFIACPSTEEVETMLALITEKLTKIGIETVIAIKERAYGQDIFCTKICGKIIESQFCLVILDDTIEQIDGRGVNIPNPNVYYECGLMTTLNKHVIPLQKEGQELAFNIQTHDTIKYTPRNLSIELDKAYKDAIKLTQEDRSGYQYIGPGSQRLFHRSLEINGYQRKGYSWFLSDDVDDTVFTGYSHPERREYLFFTVVNNKEELQETLTDMQVIKMRLGGRNKGLSNEIANLSAQIDQLDKELKEVDEQAIVKKPSLATPRRASSLAGRSTIERLTRERNESLSKQQLIQNSKFALILVPELLELKDKVVSQYSTEDKGILDVPLYIGDVTGIAIGDLGITFRVPTL